MHPCHFFTLIFLPVLVLCDNLTFGPLSLYSTSADPEFNFFVLSSGFRDPWFALDLQLAEPWLNNETAMNFYLNLTNSPNPNQGALTWGANPSQGDPLNHFATIRLNISSSLSPIYFDNDIQSFTTPTYPSFSYYQNFAFNTDNELTLNGLQRWWACNVVGWPMFSLPVILWEVGIGGDGIQPGMESVKCATVAIKKACGAAC